MKNEKILRLVLLISLGIAALLLRIPGSFSKHNLTFDEPLYVSLALQMREGNFVYNTRHFLEQCTGTHVILPNYLSKPLFKHPPLFPATIALTYKIIELCKPSLKAFFHANYNLQTYTSTNYIYQYGVLSSLFWTLVCLFFTFLIAKKCASFTIGICAAALLTIEPIFWISSQKIWIDTMLTSLLTIYMYYFILLMENKRYWIHTGIALGMACLTKYPAFIALTIPFAGLFFFPQRRKQILFSLILAALIFSPWGYQVLSVYGTAAFSARYCDEISKILRLSGKWFLPIALGLAGLIAVWKLRSHCSKLIASRYFRWIFIACLISVGAFSPYLRQQALNFFNPIHIPRNGDTARFFYYDPWYFYLVRIIELAPIHLFFYYALFKGYIFRLEKPVALVCLFPLLFLTAMIIWHNPQCRYILPCIPVITIIDVLCIQKVWQQSSHRGKTGITVLLIYAIYKTVWIGWNIAIPNNACYF